MRQAQRRSARGNRRRARNDAPAAGRRLLHLAIFAAANNQFLLRSANSFYLASRRRRERFFTDPDNGRRSFEQHRKLRDAIEKRNRLSARKLLGRHLGSVERYWMSTLPQPDSTERIAR